MYLLRKISGSVPFRKIPIPVWVLVLCGTKRDRFKYEHNTALNLFWNESSCCENMFLFHNLSKTYGNCFFSSNIQSGC